MRSLWIAWGIVMVSQAVMFVAFYNLLKTVKIHTKIHLEANKTFEHQTNALAHMTHSIKSLAKAVAILNGQDPSQFETEVKQ